MPIITKIIKAVDETASYLNLPHINTPNNAIEKSIKDIDHL